MNRVRTHLKHVHGLDQEEVERSITRRHLREMHRNAEERIKLLPLQNVKKVTDYAMSERGYGAKFQQYVMLYIRIWKKQIK
ncbi:hypothetical protein N7491_003023 [Penicillium cf. griseofulvum]|uniref:Uncharacterized protein n=1 Tax=Penicillium cf. griseofulvum TaxID=2972120 RepID=A0A9W9T1X1_9EURO|nr:hypothetical protein N7472_002805 [Penicillium cf. griseofulvum]KAJ5440617.1 hypothetical protein N7491_003023 [Penicillium cf. griseofulvum]KAJ5448668.1 hypothetical protein N7445_003489 [Penicillium cf. griseofulvum]